MEGKKVSQTKIDKILADAKKQGTVIGSDKPKSYRQEEEVRSQSNNNIMI